MSDPGAHPAKTRREPRVCATGELEAFLAEFGMVVDAGGSASTPSTDEPAPAWELAGLTDADVRHILFDEFENGEAYRQFYAGELEHDDASSGD